MRRTIIWGVLIGLVTAVWVQALSTPSPRVATPRPDLRAAPLPEASDMRAILASGRAGPAIALEADITDYTAMNAIERYPVLDPNGDRSGKQEWRVVMGTGNCC